MEILTVGCFSGICSRVSHGKKIKINKKHMVSARVTFLNTGYLENKQLLVINSHV